MRIEKAYFWPDWLITTYSKDKKFKIQKKFFGKTQIHLWRALNIYDDFLDNEGIPKELPSGNFHFRNFFKNLYTSNLPPYFLNWEESKLRTLEKANEKEASYKKLQIENGLIKIPKHLPAFNNLPRLSDKSLALAISPIAALVEIKLIKNVDELKILNNFFKYALAAKQLADDACDWLEDLQNGQVTTVNVLILKMAKSKNIKLNLKKRPEIVHLLFVEAASEKTCNDIIELCRKAKQEAKKAKIDTKAEIIIKLIEPLELAAQKALDFKKML